MHFLQAINSDVSVLIVCNKTGGTTKEDIKKGLPPSAYRCNPNYPTFTLQKVRRQSEMRPDKGMATLYEQTTEFIWNLNASTTKPDQRSTSAPPPVLSPSSIPPPPSPSSAFLPQGKIRCAFQEWYYFDFFYFF